MTQGLIVTDEMKAAYRIGEERGPYTYEVERGWIRRFAEAIGDPNPLWRDADYARREGRFGDVIAPPTFFAALDPVETEALDPEGEAFLAQLPYRRNSAGNAFNEVEYSQPVRAGDTISVTTTFTDIYEREGGTGRLLFRVRENVLKNQRGELVAKTRCGWVVSLDLTQKEGQ